MTTSIRPSLSALALAFAASPGILANQAPAVAAEPVANALTIYSSAQAGAVPPQMYRNGGQGQSVPGYAVVRHERRIPLTSGRNEIRFTDVAALIDPTTVSFKSLSDPEGTVVLEQNYEYDIVGSAKLLRKYVDQEIAVVTEDGGTLSAWVYVLREG